MVKNIWKRGNEPASLLGGKQGVEGTRSNGEMEKLRN